MTEPVILESVEPLALVVRGSATGEVAAWACGKCRYVALSEEHARSCCATLQCPCGKTIERKHWKVCRDCENARYTEEQERKENEAFEKAEKVQAKDWDGPVVLNGDRFFSCVEDLLDDLDGEDDPKYVWACRKVGLGFDADDVINNALESQEHHEDARDSITHGDVEELQALLTTWATKQRVETWWEDRTKAVILNLPQVEDQDS